MRKINIFTSFFYSTSSFYEAFSGDLNQYLTVGILPMCYHAYFDSIIKALLFFFLIFGCLHEGKDIFCLVHTKYSVNYDDILKSEELHDSSIPCFHTPPSNFLYPELSLGIFLKSDIIKYIWHLSFNGQQHNLKLCLFTLFTWLFVLFLFVFRFRIWIIPEWTCSNFAVTFQDAFFFCLGFYAQLPTGKSNWIYC